MADLVLLGDNFAVLAALDNDEGVSFYILQCQSPKHVLNETLECSWGGHFQVGDSILSGTYYQKWGCKDLQNYVYLHSSQVAHVDASTVPACKFQMTAKEHRVKGGHHVYTLLEETLNVVNSALDCLWKYGIWLSLCSTTCTLSDSGHFDVLVLLLQVHEVSIAEYSSRRLPNNNFDSSCIEAQFWKRLEA